MSRLMDLKDGWYDLTARITVQIVEKGAYFGHCGTCQLTVDSGRMKCDLCGTLRGLTDA